MGYGMDDEDLFGEESLADPRPATSNNERNRAKRKNRQGRLAEENRQLRAELEVERSRVDWLLLNENDDIITRSDLDAAMKREG